MDWDSYRSQFRSEHSNKSGDRNCALALGSLNPESVEQSSRANHAQWMPLILQNTASHRFATEIQPNIQGIDIHEIDACFRDGNIDFLREERSGNGWLDAPEVTCEQTFEEELGLLESVQEIAVSLARTPPRRTVLDKETAK